MVESQRRGGPPGTPVTIERRSYTSSLAADTPQRVERFAEAVRGHWGIENQVHWVLDLTFREDERRVRKNHAPQNLATLRHLTLNLLRRDKTTQVGLETKRLKAGWDERYQEQLLTL